MELVEGETLADRVQRGPLPVDEALPLARQIAEALDYAHEHGVLHRDLKPANIKVTPDGQVKVLDFGLAKALSPDGSALSQEHSPTITSPAFTQAGVLLGTAAYMSPEQARGKTVDKRADIWAFGCVLYELLTGTRAFEGETISDTLAAVLKGEPDWQRLPADTPATVRALLRHCLTRDPKERLRDMGDARRELDGSARADAGAPLATPSATSRRSGALPWAVTATLVAALGATLMQWAPWRPAASAPVHRLTIDLGVEATLRTDVGTAAVLSPDGHVLAFAAQPVGGNQSFLYVRRLDQLTATQLPGTADARGPFFSPDGAWIAFFADGKLKKIETRGGAPLTLCDAPVPRGGDWTEDGRIVFLPTTGGGQGLQQVPAAGGVPTPFIDADTSGSQRWPQVLPGGGAVLYTRIQPGTTASLYVQRLPSGERRRLRDGEYGRYVSSGHFVHIEDGALFSTPFDPVTLSFTGETNRIVEGLSINGADGAQFAIGGNGSLTYLIGRAIESGSPMDWLDVRGTVTTLMAETVDWLSPQFSPDGRQLVYQVAGGGLWIYDVARGARSPVTAAAARQNQRPAWTPNGQRIVFSMADDGGVPNLHWRRVDGTGDTQRVARSPYLQVQPAWHPSGRWLAFQQATPPANDIVIIPVAGSEPEGWRPGEPSVLIDGPFILADPAFSPDGRWLAYMSLESGREEVHVRPFSGPGGRIVTSTDGGRYPQWSRTANQLFFVTRNNAPAQIMVVDYTVQDGAFVPTTPRAWTTRLIMPRRLGLNYALHPDGTRVVAHVAPENSGVATTSDRLVFVTNFSDELRRLAPPAQ